jgi:hypothetical protein
MAKTCLVADLFLQGAAFRAGRQGADSLAVFPREQRTYFKKKKGI